uniref:Uncharacterized protein n=1 Tax=Timema poppense TaxID=170557 RepID=A0A7R9CXE3_TIMPO|nr:unnamed protein product [Timema poppensis]
MASTDETSFLTNNLEVKTVSVRATLLPLLQQIQLLEYVAINHKWDEKDLKKIVEYYYITKEFCLTLLRDDNSNDDCDLEAYRKELEHALIDYKISFKNFQEDNDAHLTLFLEMACQCKQALYDVLRARDCMEVEAIHRSVDDCMFTLIDLGAAADIHTASPIFKCLLILFRTVRDTGTPANAQESKRYIFKRMCVMFKDLQKVLATPSPTMSEELDGYGSQFVHKMDCVLQLLVPLYNGEIEANLPSVCIFVKNIVDEVLAHAMSIAQVSFPCDLEHVSNCCLKVLKCYDALKAECEAKEVNMNSTKLSAHTLGDSLEALEREVNTSVLRLVLEVFSDPYAPLKQLMQECSSPLIPVDQRDGMDLEPMIRSFDLQMDRIMQIALFAMACSGKAQLVLAVRSCQASLESLELELVPTLKAFYLKPDASSLKAHLKLLCAHWQSEVSALHNLVDSIVDPAAFCSVTVEIITDHVQHIKKNISYSDKIFLKEHSNALIKKAAKLEQLLNVTVHEMKPLSVQLKLPATMRKLKLARTECMSVVKVVLCERAHNDNLNARIDLLRRFELLLTAIKRLQHVLVQLMNTSEAANSPNRTDGGEDLPKAETIRSVWIPEVNQSQEDNIKDNVKNQQVAILCDETTDRKGQCVFVILLKTLHADSKQSLFVGAVKVLQDASATECLRALVDTITKYEIPYENVVCVVTDGPSCDFPASVRDLPVDQGSEAKSLKTKSYVLQRSLVGEGDSSMMVRKEDLDRLTPFRQRALRINAEQRSVLYRTPDHGSIRPVNWFMLNTVSRQQRLFSRHSNRFSLNPMYPDWDQNSIVNDSLHLDVTNILEQLTSLSYTFSAAEVKQPQNGMELKHASVSKDKFAIMENANALKTHFDHSMCDKSDNENKSSKRFGSTDDLIDGDIDNDNDLSRATKYAKGDNATLTSLSNGVELVKDNLAMISQHPDSARFGKGSNTKVTTPLFDGVTLTSLLSDCMEDGNSNNLSVPLSSGAGCENVDSVTVITALSRSLEEDNIDEQSCNTLSCFASVSSITSHEVETPQRLIDLELLNEKIRKLERKGVHVTPIN